MACCCYTPRLVCRKASQWVALGAERGRQLRREGGGAAADRRQWSGKRAGLQRDVATMRSLMTEAYSEKTVKEQDRMLSGFSDYCTTTGVKMSADRQLVAAFISALFTRTVEGQRSRYKATTVH